MYYQEKEEKGNRVMSRITFDFVHVRSKLLFSLRGPTFGGDNILIFRTESKLPRGLILFFSDGHVTAITPALLSSP